MREETTAQRTVRLAKADLEVDPAILAVESIVRDICGRKGLKSEWAEIDKEIREEDIKQTWIEIIRECYKK